MNKQQWFGVVVAAFAVIVMSGVAFAQASTGLRPQVFTAKHFYKTAPLREMQWKMPAVMRRVVGSRHLSQQEFTQLRDRLIHSGVLKAPGQPQLVPLLRKAPALTSVPYVSDPALQTSKPLVTAHIFTTPIANFQGLGEPDDTDECAPPDTDIAVGQNYVVELVNCASNPGGSTFGVFDKTGSRVLGPVPLANLWSDGVCASDGRGDGVIVYDQLAGRWVISQFAGISAPTDECIAVSETGDPTGAYYVYDFSVFPNEFADYPKIAVWPDAYYATFNVFNATGSSFDGEGFVAFNRSEMLNGNPQAQVIIFTGNGRDLAYSMLPASVDGYRPPPAGAPGIFVDYVSPYLWGTSFYALEMWQMHVDWVNPANSTLSGPTRISVDPFNDGICGYARACISEPGGAAVDAIGDRLMFRLAYRNLGSHEALVVNQTVGTGAAPSSAPAGIRWYELDAPAGATSATAWSVAQQGTYMPNDGLSRWMGSVAMDFVGDMALGFSSSDTSQNPAVSYTGRLVGDPAGTMTQAETTLVTGTGYQVGTGHRWGDYSSMVPDPSNGCTFWYTQEYYATTGQYLWSTQIGAFKFANCARATGKVQGTVTDAATGDPVADATVQLGTGVSARTDSSGNYSITDLPGSYTASATDFGYVSGNASVTITKNQASTQDFTLTPAPSATLSGTVTDGSGHGYPLYAEVRILVPGIGRVADLWTNPQTGIYSASLPQGYTYTVNARAFFDGYHSSSASVTLNGNRTQNLVLTVFSACGAPGYSFVQGFGEDFNGATFPPSGWTMTNNVSGSPVFWKSNTTWHSGNYTGGSGQAALAAGWVGFPMYFGHYDTRLVTPAVSATSLGADPLLEFKLNYQDNPTVSEALDVDVNVDDTGWITLQHITSKQGGFYTTPGVDYKLNIGPYLSGATSFKLRWRYYNLVGSGGWYAEVDDVVIGSCRPSAGGLVIGSVSDFNTGQGLVGATVGNDTGASTKTIENAADPNLPKGYYFLFSPAGTHTVKGSRFHYSSASASVSVAVNGVTVKDFALEAGRFSAAPAAFDLQAMVNTQTQKTLTVTNTGTAPAHFHVVSVNTPPPTTAPGTGAPLSLIHCNAPLSPQSMAAQGAPPDCSAPGGGSDSAVGGATAWSAISDYPIPVVDNAMATDESTGLVYSFGGDSNGAPTAASYVYDPASGTWSPIATLPVPLEKPAAAVINGKVYVTAGWGASGANSQALYIYDPANDTWSSGTSDPVAQAGAAGVAVLNDQLYVIGGCGPGSCSGTTAIEIYDPVSDSWSAAAHYPHPVAWEGCGGTEGKIYCAGGISYGVIYSAGYAYDPGSNRWSAIAPLPVNAGGCSSWWGGAATATASGQLLLQDGVTCGFSAITNQGFSYDVGSDSWSSLPNALSAGYRMGSACGFYMVGGNPFNGTAAGEVLSGYDVCTIKPIPWLTMAPASDTIGTGNAAAVQLTFDGTGRAEFTTSRAYLLMPSTTPYGPKIVPLTVTWTPQPVALSTGVAADRNPVAPNRNIAFNVVVKNLTTPGDGGATQVVLSFDLPASLSYVQGGAGCSVSAGVVSCALGSIAQGAEQDVTIVLEAGGVGSYRMTFTAHAREPQDNNIDQNVHTLVGRVAAAGGGGGGFGGLTLIILLGLVLIGIRARRRYSGDDKMMKRGWSYGEVFMPLAGFRFRLGSIQRLVRMPGSRWVSRKCRLFTAVAAAVIGVGFAGAVSAAPPTPSSAGISRQNTFVSLPFQTDAQLLTQKAQLVGPHPKSSTIKLTIGLKLRSADRLQTFLQEVQYPPSSEYHHFLTPQQFTKLYGPTTTEVNAVVRFLRQYNIQVSDVAPNRILIHTKASTGAYEAAFKIRVNDYTLNGRSFFSTTDRPQIPLSLSGIVLNVLGLNNSRQMRPHSYVEPLRGRQGPLTTAPPPSTAFFNPEQIAKAYDWPAITDSSNGAGVSVAIVTADSSGLASATSASTFWSSYGLPSHTVNVIPVDGDQGSTLGMIETLLDMEYSGAMAPGITQNVYVASNAGVTTFTDAYNRFVNDDTSQVMTTSWGIYESADPAQFQTDEQIFAQAAAEGISMFAAAGDHGSGDGAPWGNDHADFPSSSEYITAANGTELSISDISGTYASEHAWSDTGGAISQLFTQPLWQTGPGVPNSGFRMNSDMALNAGGLHPYLMYISSRGFVGVYGTSAVAPILAGLFAIGVSQQPGDASLGQSNKLIYGDVNAGNYATDFHDVTTGSNGAFSAGPGWDHPTGWGSPRATSLLSHLGILGPEGALMGTITDASTGLPIAGARITISPGNAIRHTAGDGTYAILLGAGAHTITVSDFGYGSQSQPVSISDGQTVTQDFALTLRQTATLSGTVSDDSGHGYGLYSEVTVSTAGFGQVANIWTNPATGGYTDALPVGYTYTIAVHAFLDGYLDGSASVIFGGATTQDFVLKVLSACTAPGYTFVQQGLGEDFNGTTFPPAGWTVNTPVNNGRTIWQLNTGYGNDNYTNGTGTAAEADDECPWWTCGRYDTRLITPPIPVPASGYNPILRYTANYQFYSQSSLDLDISTDGGSTWTNILRWNSRADDCGWFYGIHHGCNVSVQLGPYLTGATSFQLRWRYYDPYWAAWDWYAQIDDVSVGICHAVAGGLVVGSVSDANTGQGVVDATVGDDTGASTKTIENAADPNLPKGYYFLFSPAGTRTVTVSRINYANAGATFAVANNAVVGKDFMLDAGRFSAAPAAFDLQAMVNTQTQKTFTVTNTGTAPVHFDIQQVDSPPPAVTGLGTGASLIAIHCNGRLSPASMAAQGTPPDCSASGGGGMHSVAGVSAWSAISDYPIPIGNNTMTTDEVTGLVYSFGGISGKVRTAASYVYHPGTDSWSSIAALPVPLANAVAGVIGGKVYVTAGWGTSGVPSQALYIYDPASDSWSSGASDPVVQAGAPGVAVLNDQLYVIGGCGVNPFCWSPTAVEVYDPASDTWSMAANYPHPVAWEGCGEILGRIYCAGGTDGPFTTYSDGYVYDPGSNRWSAIASLPTNAEGCNDWWGGAATASAGGQLLLQDGVTCRSSLTNQGFAYDVGSDSWSSLPDALTAVYRTGSACGFYMVGGDGAAGEVLPGYDVCTIKPIPWLTMAPASGTIGTGNAATVQLTFDGTGQAEFTTSQAYLLMPSTTPYGPKIVPLMVTWTPQPVALSTGVAVDLNPVAPNRDITFNVGVKNLIVQSDGGATQVVLSFDLPASLSYVQGGTGCSVGAGVVSCALGNIAQGAEQDVTIVLKSVLTGTYRITFTAHAREPQDNNIDQNVHTFVGKITAAGGRGGFGWLTLIILLGFALAGTWIKGGHKI